MRVLALLLAVLAGPALADPEPPAAEPEPTPIVRAEFEALTSEVLLPTVQIGQTSQGSQRRFCSGSIFHSDRDEASGEVTTLVLSSRHCFDAVGEEVDVIIPVVVDNRIVEERVLKAVVASRYALHDLAYLRLRDTENLFTNLVTIAPKGTVLYEGEPVWAVGFPMGLTRTFTSGSLGMIEQTDVVERGKMWDFYRITPSVFGGNSGGPIFHMNAAGHYEQIGTLTGGYVAVSFMNWSTPLPTLHQFIDTALKAEERRLAALR